MQLSIGAYAAILLIVLAGCGEESVRSTYKPRAPQIVITLPDIDASGPALGSKVQIVLPLKKKFEIRARILNFSRLTTEVKGRRLEVEFRSATGTPRQSLLLENTEQADGDAQVVRVVALPLVRSGPHEVVIAAFPDRVEIAKFPAVVRE